MSLRWLKRKGFAGWSDQQLLEAFQQSGEDRYFYALLGRYIHRIYYNCKTIIPNEEDCKDIVMTIAGRVYENLPTADIQYFRSWLFSVAKNQCIDHLRSQNGYVDKNVEWEMAEEINPQVMEPEAHALYLQEETEVAFSEEKVQIALKTLEADQQLCLHLFYFEEKSYKEIMEVTHFTAKEVKSHLQNGKRKLKRALSILQNKP